MRVRDALAAERLLAGLEEFGGCRIAFSGECEDALTALYAAVALGGRDVRLCNLLYSLKSLVDNRMYLWGPSVFSYGLLLHTDIPLLLAALMENHVRVCGLLDHMRQPMDGDEPGELLRLLDELGRIGGGSVEIVMP